MRQTKADWRHWAAALLMLAAVSYGMWRISFAGAPRPTSPAPAGAHPRMQDATEGGPNDVH